MKVDKSRKMPVNDDDLYTLDTLLEALNEIRVEGQGDLNFPKAFYCLALEIDELRKFKKFVTNE